MPIHQEPTSPAIYRTRFAPSPTGPLHFGSLVAAVGSYLQARALGGEWLVRIEDVDIPRNVPGAAQDILETLAALGMHPDGEVVYQSARTEIYREVIGRLVASGDAFPCACSRSEIGGPVYPGTCRDGIADGRTARSVRLRVAERTIAFEDAVQGRYTQHLPTDVGDFVISRADGCIAYQLAVVVDDYAQGITEVVRGADLLDSTPRQIHLIRTLGYPQPDYAHLPIVLAGDGQKLSKQTGATAVDRQRPVAGLCAALAFLGHPPPPGMDRATLAEVWTWATANWRIGRVPGSVAA